MNNRFLERFESRADHLFDAEAYPVRTSATDPVGRDGRHRLAVSILDKLKSFFGGSAPKDRRTVYVYVLRFNRSGARQ